MQKSQKFRKAWLLSLVAILLCIAMLVGTAFAWFTDSVTSGKNTITAGNLDVELYHVVDGENKEVGSDDDLFFLNTENQPIRWEPEVMAYETFTVANVGSLALKYELYLEIADANTVVEADGTETEKTLADVIRVAVVSEKPADRETARKAFDGTEVTLKDFSKACAGELFPKDNKDGKPAEEAFTVILYWPQSGIDNEYNLQNGKYASDSNKDDVGELSVDVVVNLVATQTPYEEDSFSNDYDKDASFPETYKVATGAELKDAISTAKDGDTIVLTQNATIAGYAATEKLTIDKAVTLDLNGYTLVTESGWGGIDAKNGCSIKNGTIHHTGNTAAIKAFQVEAIEDVEIAVEKTDGKVKGGVVVQEGSGCYVGSIKNVTITGATNGIETYLCGNRTDLAIGSLENVTVNDAETGFILSAPVGTATGCTFKGSVYGINMHLKGAYSVSIDLVGCAISGTTAGIFAHDEPGKTNPGTFVLTYDAATTIEGGIVQNFEEETNGRITIKQVP